MKLSKKVWVLWSVRIFAVCVLLFAVISSFEELRPWGYFALGAGITATAAALIMRYLGCRLKTDAEGVALKEGILLRRSIFIKHSCVCATRRIQTPLSAQLNLCNIVLYCEGVAFWLPPVDPTLLNEIETHTENAREQKNEG